MSIHTSIRSLGPCALALALASTASAAQGTPSCSTGVGCQFPDQQGWQLSDGNPIGRLWAFENFKPTASGNVSSLCWWGTYWDFSSSSDCAPGAGDSFKVTYYRDDDCDGVSGSVIAGA